MRLGRSWQRRHFTLQHPAFSSLRSKYSKVIINWTQFATKICSPRNLRDHLLTAAFYFLSGMIAWQGIHQYHQNQMINHHKILHNSNCANPKNSQVKFPSNLDKKPGLFECPNCGKYYRWLRNMRSHLKIECGKDPKECCPYCPHRTKYKSSLHKHIQRMHPENNFA